MAKPPAFQFYAKDFLTGTMTMSLMEIGAYIKLLAWSWDNGPLPIEASERATILGVRLPELRRVWVKLAPKWAKTKAGYVNTRLEQQRTALNTYREKQAEAGKRGAVKRWDSHAESDRVAYAETIATPVVSPQPKHSSSICDLRSASPEVQEPDPPKERA